MMYEEQGVKTFEQDGDVQIFLIFIFFIFCSAVLQKQQKIVTCFLEDKLSTIYVDFQF